MMTSIATQMIKTRLEKVHLDFLCKELPFNPAQRNGVACPDLVSAVDERCYFELKSRTFPHEQQELPKRPRSSFGWWGLDKDQIGRYEAFAAEKNAMLHWVFLLCETARCPTLEQDFSENHVLHRTIYLLPWSVYTIVPVSASGWHHVGENRIRRLHDFDTMPVTKGIVYAPNHYAHLIRK